VPGVLYAFGHQHIGWTLGGITGRLVADLATGKAPEVDLAPFSARRFRGKPWWPYA
jgi:D-amino-acid dehydrogenase